MAAPIPVLRRRAAVLSVLLLVALVIHNAYWLVENQRELPSYERPHPSPHDIEEVARQNPQSRISGQVASFYHLAQRIPGAAITLPPRLEAERWFFERVARLQVTMSSVRLVISPGSIRPLRAARTAVAHWRVRKPGGKPRTIALNIRLDPGADAYVLAERLDGRELFLLPAVEFPAVAHRP